MLHQVIVTGRVLDNVHQGLATLGMCARACVWGGWLTTACWVIPNKLQSERKKVDSDKYLTGLKLMREIFYPVWPSLYCIYDTYMFVGMWDARALLFSPRLSWALRHWPIYAASKAWDFLWQLSKLVSDINLYMQVFILFCIILAHRGKKIASFYSTVY